MSRRTPYYPVGRDAMGVVTKSGVSLGRYGKFGDDPDTSWLDAKWQETFAADNKAGADQYGGGSSSSIDWTAAAAMAAGAVLSNFSYSRNKADAWCNLVYKSYPGMLASCLSGRTCLNDTCAGVPPGADFANARGIPYPPSGGNTPVNTPPPSSGSGIGTGGAIAVGLGLAFLFGK